MRGNVTHGASFKKSCFGASRSRCHPGADSFLASNVILALVTAGVHEVALRGLQVS